MSVAILGLSLLPACEGPQGPAGDPGPGGNNALTRTSAEAAGTNCKDGGFKIEIGLDKNSNGTLDDDEVSSSATRYVCDGAGGTGNAGKNALVKVSAEPEGTNCPNGGQKIETGIDDDGNGTLDPGEVNSAATTYVCNGGTPGPSGSVFPSTGINVEIKEVSPSTATGPITVRFLLKDDRGFPIDIKGAPPRARSSRTASALATTPTPSPTRTRAPPVRARSPTTRRRSAKRT
ncbi:MAG: hypothetical protein KC503_12365 [Myxococcales bacterium]|nr:hypothetical protein [Myxococcales bacterium]